MKTLCIDVDGVLFTEGYKHHIWWIPGALQGLSELARKFDVVLVCTDEQRKYMKEAGVHTIVPEKKWTSAQKSSECVVSRDASASIRFGSVNCLDWSHLVRCV